jgi:hypothetical protein
VRWSLVTLTLGIALAAGVYNSFSEKEAGGAWCVAL